MAVWLALDVLVTLVEPVPVALAEAEPVWEALGDPVVEEEGVDVLLGVRLQLAACMWMVGSC